MILAWSVRGWTDYLYWQDRDAKVVRKINTLLEDIRRSPFRGLGQPEPLKGNLAGFWSRRISEEHRLVYRVVGSGAEQRIEIIQCQFHY
jgi:toxin YoeB